MCVWFGERGEKVCFSFPSLRACCNFQGSLVVRGCISLFIVCYVALSSLRQLNLILQKGPICYRS